MRIAHVISAPEGIGGAERVLADLFDASVRCGHDVAVANLTVGPASNTALQGLLGDGNYIEIRASTPLGLASAGTRLHRWFAALDPDVIHAHLPKAAAAVAASQLPVIRGGAVTVLSHQHGDHFRRTNQRRRELIDRAVCRRFDRVVACSEMVRQFLLQEYRLDADRVVTIRNGWAGEPLPHVGGGGRTVVCVANFRPQKNHRLLIQAFAEVTKRLPDAELVLVGSGPLRPDIEQLVQERGLDGCIRFAGPTPDIWPELSKADVFVLPSTYEPLGIVVLEAMAAGLPVVAFPVGGIPEIVTSGVEGTLVGSHDPIALADAVVALLEDGTTRELMSQAGHKRAAKETANRMAASYLQTYRDLVA